MVAARVAMVAVALAVVFVLWTWLGAARDYERAAELATSTPLSSAQAEQVRRDLLAAGRHTPSTEPEVALAQFELFLSQPRRAADELGGVVSREPDNATAWGLLARALTGVDAPASRAAARREAQLRAGFVRRRD